MDERTLRALEFPRVLERLSAFCLSEAGKEAALALRPLADADAVRAAHDKAAEGDAVLLSPASASFDAFKNFAQRGKTFKDIVGRL